MQNQLTLTISNNINMQAVGLQALNNVMEEFRWQTPAPQTERAIELRLRDLFLADFEVRIPDEYNINIKLKPQEN